MVILFLTKEPEICLGEKTASCTWESIAFQRPGKFSAIFSLKRFTIPLVCISALSSNPWID
jgi:hypothetical protein